VTFSEIIIYLSERIKYNNKKFGDLVKSLKLSFPVIPANLGSGSGADAGIQYFQRLINILDSGFHRKEEAAPLWRASWIAIRVQTGCCMNQDEIFKKTTEYLITQFKIPPEKISLQANLYKDLGLDSIDALDWFAAMESKIGLPIIENELKMIRTVQDVVEYVLRNLR